MPTTMPQRETVLTCLRQFLDTTSRGSMNFDDRSHLMRDLGLTSDEGVDFVLDLCDVLGFELPGTFNPFVHESGRRGLRVGEMVTAVMNLVPVSEAIT